MSRGRKTSNKADTTAAHAAPAFTVEAEDSSEEIVVDNQTLSKLNYAVGKTAKRRKVSESAAAASATSSSSSSSSASSAVPIIEEEGIASEPASSIVNEDVEAGGGFGLNRSPKAKVRFSADEDALIEQRVGEWGNRGQGLWVSLERELGRRADTIRQRWTRVISNNINNSKAAAAASGDSSEDDEEEAASARAAAVAVAGETTATAATDRGTAFKKKSLPRSTTGTTTTTTIEAVATADGTGKEASSSSSMETMNDAAGVLPGIDASGGAGGAADADGAGGVGALNANTKEYCIRWTTEMDSRLTEAVDTFGDRDWVSAARFVGCGVDNAQCRNRWYKHTNPSIQECNTGPWQDEEVEMLAQMVAVHINDPSDTSHGRSRRRESINWTTISKALNRPYKDCQHKWRSVQAKGMQKGPYRPEEDAVIRQRVTEWGDKGQGLWVGLEKELGRAADTVRKRWDRISGRDKKGVAVVGLGLGGMGVGEEGGGGAAGVLAGAVTASRGDGAQYYSSTSSNQTSTGSAFRHRGLGGVRRVGKSKSKGATSTTSTAAGATGTGSATGSETSTAAAALLDDGGEGGEVTTSTVADSAAPTTAADAAAAAGEVVPVVGPATTAQLAAEKLGQPTTAAVKALAEVEAAMLHWTADMDERLREAVSLYGDKHWMNVANHVGDNVGRQQCRNRWVRYANPILLNFTAGPWSDEESEKLRVLVPENTKQVGDAEGTGRHRSREIINWTAISQALNRSYKDCQHKWRSVCAKFMHKGHFTPEEDAVIQQRVTEWGDRGQGLWVGLERELGRAADTVRKRWDRIAMKLHKRGDEVIPHAYGRLHASAVTGQVLHPQQSATTGSGGDTTELPDALNGSDAADTAAMASSSSSSSSSSVIGAKRRAAALAVVAAEEEGEEEEEDHGAVEVGAATGSSGSDSDSSSDEEGEAIMAAVHSSAITATSNSKRAK